MPTREIGREGTDEGANAWAVPAARNKLERNNFIMILKFVLKAVEEDLFCSFESRIVCPMFCLFLENEAAKKVLSKSSRPSFFSLG